jgi:hypothetical protein
MIEVEMRVDDEVDPPGITADGRQARGYFLTGRKSNSEQLGETRAESLSGIALTVRMQPGVKQSQAFWMFDQEYRDWQTDDAFTTLHQAPEFAGYGAAGECVKFDARHRFGS